jgi:hypothetical protein
MIQFPFPDSFPVARLTSPLPHPTHHQMPLLGGKRPQARRALAVGPGRRGRGRGDGAARGRGPARGRRAAAVLRAARPGPRGMVVVRHGDDRRRGARLVCYHHLDRQEARPGCTTSPTSTRLRGSSLGMTRPPSPSSTPFPYEQAPLLFPFGHYFLCVAACFCGAPCPCF